MLRCGDTEDRSLATSGGDKSGGGNRAARVAEGRGMLFERDLKEGREPRGGPGRKMGREDGQPGRRTEADACVASSRNEVDVAGTG